MLRVFLRGVAGVALLIVAHQATAQQRYDIHFVASDEGVEGDGGGSLVVGRLLVDAFDTPDGYRVTLDQELFGDYFLSMRPFRCITDNGRMLCHLPYPYENRRTISRDDLTDLEYDLLFIARKPNEYGIDPWNGRYFRLRWEGDVIVGAMHEVDLDILASPPDAGNDYPLADAEMLPLKPGASQWAPVLRLVPAR